MPTLDRAATQPRRLQSWAVPLACLVVAAVVALAHAPAFQARGLALDDQVFVTENPLVMQPGLNSAKRFFAEVLEPSTVNAYYMPLTMTSLMVDAALGGRPDDLRAFHATNLALHVISVVLVLLILYQLFGSLVPAALVAALYGLHPLTVEAVVSIGERKTVLSTALAFASLYAWIRHARGSGRPWYFASIAAFALALLAKPAVMAMPVLLVLLDIWPLRRGVRRAARETWPFFALAAAAAVISVLSVARTWEFGAMPATSAGHTALQIAYVLGFDVTKIVWPVPLSPIYPPPAPFTLANPEVMHAVAVTVIVTLAVVGLAWRTRGPLIGWLGFVKTLAPTFAILRFGSILTYDRYIYFPAIGLLIAVGAALTAWWGVAADRTRRGALIAAVTLVAIAEIAGTRATLAHWKDSLTIWRHIVAAAPRRAEAQNGLGAVLLAGGAPDSALTRFRLATELDPGYGDAQLNLGIALSLAGRTDEALEHLRRAATLSPRSVSAALQLGMASQRAGRFDEAAVQFERALRLRPSSVDAMDHLGVARLLQGRTADGMALLRDAVAKAPDDALPHFTLAASLIQSPTTAGEAMDHLRTASRLRPSWAPPLNELAWRLATYPRFRNPAEALRLADRAVTLTEGHDASALDTRAAALAAAGRFADAITTAREALAIAERAPGDPLGAAIATRLAIYERGVAFTEVPGER